MDTNSVRANMEQKSSTQLLDIISFSQDDYRPEAIAIIKDILLSRGVPQEEIDTANNGYKKIISNTTVTETQKRIPKINKYLLWVFYIAALVMFRYLVKIGTVAYVQYFDTPKDSWAGIKSAVRIEADSLLKGSVVKDKWCNCIINKFQSSYPQGEASIPKDSFKNVSFRYGRECASTLDFELNGWNENVIHSIKGALMQTPVVLKMKTEYQEPFCDCFISELKSKYPNGINNKIPKEAGDTIIMKCGKQVIK